MQFSLDALTLPASVPISVPSRLVERRPDVRAADAQLHAATANVGVAIGNMLPQITLNASLGSVATQKAQILAGQSEFWSVGATLSQTLFAGGALWHRERAARAALDQAGAEYRAAVFTAFQNVADVLRALAADADAAQATERGASVSAASLEVARHQYDLGAVGYLALISAQQTYQQALIAQVQARSNRYLDTAALFQALGGAAPRPRGSP